MEELPSRTDAPDELTTDTVVSQPAAQPELVSLNRGEVEHLQTLEERNRYLTMLLGDRVMTVNETLSELEKHREVLKDAYSFTLKAHGIDQGQINTRAGVIAVISRLPKE